MRGVVSPRRVSAPDQPCIWMSARVLDFKLCDRGFDCQHCPLHAALVGAPWLSAAPTARSSENTLGGFPADRRYSSGHTWVCGPDAAGIARVGLDAFAVSLIGVPHRLRRTPDFRMLERGEPVCECDLDEGVLPIGAPLAGRVWECNAALTDAIDALVADPYGEGWLAELQVEPGQCPDELFGGAEALRRARLDAGRFCRGAAMRMLADPGRWGDLSASRVFGVTNLHSALGADGFLELLRDLVH